MKISDKRYNPSNKESVQSLMGSPSDSDCKESTCNAGDLGLIPGLGTFPGEGNGKPLQYPCLGNPRTEEPEGLQSTGSQRVRHN